MDEQLKFPDSHKLAEERASEFQQMAAADRLRLLMDTIASGLAIIQLSPNREMIDRLFLEKEAAWQQFQKELIREHGR